MVANNLLAARNRARALKGDFNFNRLPPDTINSPTIISDIAAVNRMRRLWNAGLLRDATHGFDAHTYYRQRRSYARV